MANEVFFDASGWVALLNASDDLHESAIKVWEQLGRTRRRIVLTDWIIAETGNGLARVKHAARFPEAAVQMLESFRVEVVFIDRDLLNQALDWYKRYRDKSWGLVDCASFALMQDRGMTDAFSSDQHFRQAGFNCLLAADQVK